MSSCGTGALEWVGGLSCSVGMWVGSSSPTRDGTHIPCIGRLILTHRTTREVPLKHVLSRFNCAGCVLCLVAQPCPTLCDPMDCSPPGSSDHGISQARILEWAAISYSQGSSQPRDQTHISYVSCIGGWVLYHYVNLERS